MSTGYVEVEGGRLWYEEAGSGRAVLLLHAGGGDSGMWSGHLERFAARYRTIAFDFPGAGRSPYPELPWSATHHIDRLLDALGIDRVAPVGVSLGGGVATDFAIERPDRTWALVVVASGPRGIEDIQPDPRSMEVYEAVMVGDLERAADLFIEVWSPLRTSPELDAAIRRMVEANIGMLTELGRDLVRLPEWSAADRLAEIRVPTLALWGDADAEEVQRVGERLVEGVGGARRVVLPGVDHFVPMRAPEAFDREVLAFLNGVASD
jgi:3-oxoadipate enol-lactonase